MEIEIPRPKRLYVSNDGRLLVDEKRNIANFGDDVDRAKTLVSTVGNGLVLKESTIPNAGFGVFATRTFQKGEVVTYFDGAVSKRISVTEIDPSYKSHARRINGFYTMYGNFTAIGEPIDLTKGFNQVMSKGAGAFINAKSGDLANVEWFLLRARSNLGRTDESEDPFKIVILIYALKKINKGSELFIDYGEDYWNVEISEAKKGIVKPVFITREAYYRALEEEKTQNCRRVVKRMAPTLLTQDDDTKKKQRTDQCVQCSSYTEMVDTNLRVFLCSIACRDMYTINK